MFDAIFAPLLALNFWAWMVFVVWFVDLVSCAVYERGVVAFLSSVIAISLLWWQFDLNLLLVVVHHPLYAFGFSVGYLFFGWLWSRRELKRFGKKAKEALLAAMNELRTRYLHRLEQDSRNLNNWLENTIGIKNVDIKTLDAWKAELTAGKIPEPFRADYESNLASFYPKWTSYVDKLVAWITLWPFSMTWYFMADFIHDLVLSIVTHFRASYEKIIADIFKDVDLDLSKCKE
jgi:hypothetical protein